MDSDILEELWRSCGIEDEVCARDRVDHHCSNGRVQEESIDIQGVLCGGKEGVSQGVRVRLLHTKHETIIPDQRSSFGDAAINSKAIC
jgi:hypothetical protein